MDCVEKTKEVTKAMAEKKWDLAVELRGKSFLRNLETYRMLSKNKPRNYTNEEIETKNLPLWERRISVLNEADMNAAMEQINGGKGHTLAVMHVGAPCCGMNAAARSFVRTCISGGHRPLGIQSGVEGLVNGRIKEIQWGDVDGWVSQGGANLGTKRTLPNGKFPQIAQQLKNHKIEGLMVVGGFEAFQTVLELAEERKNYPEFCIPMCVLPATISNNVPGTEFSLGADTALNEITEICDRIRQSAQGTKERVFIIEVMGGYCGYLASMAGLAGGSDAAYIHEEHVGIRDLLTDFDVMVNKIQEGKVQRGLIINNEKANENYTTDFLTRLYSEEGKRMFTARQNILGHMQQGGNPSPFDRNFGTKMGVKVYNWLLEQLSIERTITAADIDTACILGLRSRAYQFQSVEKLKEETDFQYRRWKRQWWMHIRSIMKILAMHESTYTVGEGIEMIGVND